MFEIFFKVVLIHPFILPYNKHLLGKLNMWYTLPGGFTFNLILEQLLGPEKVKQIQASL